MFTQNTFMIGTSLAGTLLPAINAVITPIAKLMGWMATGIEKFPVIGWVIGGLAAGFTLYAVGLGVATAAQWAMNAAMLANPIGLLAAGIVVAAGAIYTYWEPIKGFFSGLLDGIKSAFSTTWDWMKGLLSFTPLGLITNNWGAISGFFSNLWGGIIDQARSALDWLLGKFEAVTRFIGDTWNTVAGWFSDDDKENPSKTTSRKPDLKPVALAATIAAATLPATAMAVNQATPAQHTNHSTHTYQLTIQQLPGEDPQALTERIMLEIERRQQQRQREGLRDDI